jgi:DNA-binding transcriptional regulator GbsR (MarR family)
MFTLVANQRKRREIDPILNTLRRCQEELSPEKLGDQAGKPAAQERLQRVNDLLSFLTLVDGLAQRFFESHRGLRDAMALLTQDSH